MNRTKHDRRATKNLPWQDGWLTVYRGKLPGESHKQNSTIFCASNGADRRLLYSAFSTKNYDEHGRLTAMTAGGPQVGGVGRLQVGDER